MTVKEFRSRAFLLGQLAMLERIDSHLNTGPKYQIQKFVKSQVAECNKKLARNWTRGKVDAS